MERKNKNQISTLLMIVGVIFIMIAGSIFVTTAWQHLSENGKRLILTGIVAALYTVSWKLRDKEILSKTEHALYYLAAAGTGFLTVSFLGGWSTTVDGYLSTSIANGTLNNADRAMWGLFATGLAVGYRFFKERKVWDFSILAIIFFNMFCLVFGANIHDMAGIIPLMGLTLLATIQYMDKKQIGYRIAQSIGIIVVNHFFFYELYEVLFDGIDNSTMFIKWWFFVPLVIDVIFMVMAERIELVFITSVANWFMTFAQVAEGFESWSKEGSHLFNIVPFALSVAFGFTIMWKRTDKDEYKKLAITGGVFSVFELSMYVLMQSDWYDDLGWGRLNVAAMFACVMVAFIFAFIDCVLHNDIAKHIMKTFELVFGEIAALFLVGAFDLDELLVEVMSIFVGAGIVLLGMIWYDKEKGIRVAQFILTCATLFVLLIHNIEVQELNCLMFLGITGIIMLIVAAIFNHKEYVIASSVTLSLLAIYLTREFWMSIAWWVYLFAAGVVLVGIAIKKEREA